MGKSKLYYLALVAACLILSLGNSYAQDTAGTGEQKLEMAAVSKMLMDDGDKKGLITLSKELEKLYKDLDDLDKKIMNKTAELNRLQAPYSSEGDSPRCASASNAIKSAAEASRYNSKGEKDKRAGQIEKIEKILKEYADERDGKILAISTIENENSILVVEVGSTEDSYAVGPVWELLVSQLSESTKVDVVARAIEKSGTFSIAWEKKHNVDFYNIHISGGKIGSQY